jgi:hypothetical protein
MLCIAVLGSPGKQIGDPEAIIMPTIVRDIDGASFYTWAAML